MVAEILGTWIGVMILITGAIILTAIMVQIFSTFFNYFEKANKEKSLAKKIKYYAVCFSMIALMALIVVIVCTI